MRRFGKRLRPSRAPGVGVLAVEMEAAALYAFARARDASVLCLAHVTNAMGQGWQDFEKGEADGTADSLKIMQVVIKAVRSRSKGPSQIYRDGSTCSNLDLAGISSSASLQPASPSWPIRSPTCGPL